MTLDPWGALGGLFASAFIAATLLPAQSEALLAGLIATNAAPTPALIIAATLGNVLGSLVNWWLGVNITRFQHRPWFPASPAQMDRASHWFQRWGVWTLLLAWLPIVGDPLTLVAGVARVNIWWFLTLVTIGKAGRYLVIGLAI